VTGGSKNTASAPAASVSGGYQLKAAEPHDWVARKLKK